MNKTLDEINENQFEESEEEEIELNKSVTDQRLNKSLLYENWYED